MIISPETVCNGGERDAGSDQPQPPPEYRGCGGGRRCQHSVHANHI